MDLYVSSEYKRVLDGGIMFQLGDMLATNRTDQTQLNDLIDLFVLSCHFDIRFIHPDYRNASSLAYETSVFSQSGWWHMHTGPMQIDSNTMADNLAMIIKHD